MVKKQTNPCGQCQSNCGSNSVFCSECSLWYHAKCEHLSPKDVSVLASANCGYICSMCADNNYDMALTRISQAADRCYSYMARFVKRESIIMRKPLVVTEDLDAADVYFHRNIDTETRALQLKYGTMLNMKPVWVYGDGNCLFNAVSVSLCGSQRLSAELRVRTVIEMVTNAEKYRGSSNAKTYLCLSPDYKEACTDCGKNGGFSSVWTMLALTTVIGRPIRSVYPPCNGPNDFPYRALNTTFLPDKCVRGKPIYVMWTSTQVSSKRTWTPNHFVPLVDFPVQDKATEMTIPTKNCSASSPTYDQDFPDLSSSLEFTQNAKRQKLSRSPGKQSDDSYLCQKQTSTSSFKTNSTPQQGNHKPKERPSFDLTPVERNSSTPLNRKIITPETQVLNRVKETREESDTEASQRVADYDQSKEEMVTVIPDAKKHCIGSSEENCQGSVTSEIAEYDDEKNTDQDISCAEENFGNRIRADKGLSAKEIYNIIMTQTDILTSVPKGIKSNCYFIVDNEDNVKKYQKNERCTYHDDCGAWDSTNTRTLDMMYIVKNGNLQNVRKKNDKYCIKKKVSGILTWHPIDPQPDDHDVVVLHKYYATLKRSPEFCKRVSWFKKLPLGHQEKLHIAVTEYAGLYPSSLSVHGRTKTENRQYVRTCPQTKQVVNEKLKNNVPVRTIFKDLQKTNQETAPRDYRVIEYLKQKEKKQSSSTSSGNLADEMLEVFKLLRTHPFVQQVNSTKDHAPTIILYTDEQIKDFQFFISKKSDHVVGVDRTFNLGATFVTCFTYKNLRVLRNKTKDHPVFFGPMFLHWDATFATYHYFFSHVRALLGDRIGDTELKVGEGFKIGSDDERALTKALDICFSASERYLCTKHIKDNLSHYLIQKEEIDEKKRRQIVSDIFGQGGLVDSDDTFQFESSANRIKSQYRQYEQFTKYFDTCLKTRLLKNVNRYRRGKEHEPLWTNNACESLNAVLKKDIDWKPKKTPELIEILYDAVTMQMMDLKAALYGSGNYHIATGYGHYLVPSAIWSTKSDDAKTKLFSDFLLDKKRMKTLKSLKARNISFEVPNEQKLAKKPGQKRKRPKTVKKFL